MSNVVDFKKVRHSKEEILTIIIDRAQEGLICLLKLQVASDKLFPDELPKHQLEEMERKLTRLLDLAIVEQKGV